MYCTLLTPIRFTNEYYYFVRKFRHINVTLSDSELEERHDIDRRTEGETTSSTKTNDDTIVRSQQSPDDGQYILFPYKLLLE